METKRNVIGRGLAGWTRVVEALGRQIHRASRAAFYPLRRAYAPALVRPAIAGGVLLLASGCQTNIFTLEDDVELGGQAYNEITGETSLVQSGAAFDMTTRVTDNLVEAARTFDTDIVDFFEWEVRLIDDDQMVNAFCLPGGKMAVYTGILPVTEGEAGLAVVMGHEIAHATKRHGTEAMTKQYGVSVLISIITDGTAQQLAGLAGSLLQLRFGRDAELEADERGLMYMARAGYDPREAVAFWQRMDALGGGAPPEWLSTHPSNENRISQIEALLPEALSIYQAAIGQNGSPAP